MLNFVEGDKTLFIELEKAFGNGLIKSLPDPGADSMNAYLLAFNDKKFFIKPTIKETCYKETLAYELAKKLGVETFLLPVCMVELQKNIFATVNPMLNDDYCSLQEFEKDNHGAMNGVLDNMIKSGDSHKLAVFDYLIENKDRHRGNLFFNGTNIILIDHGDAFASERKGHIPAYLRKSNFFPKDALPLCDNEVLLRKWLMDIKINSPKFINKIDQLLMLPGRLDSNINKWWESNC